MSNGPKFEAKANGDSLELLMYGPVGSDWWGDGSTVDAKAVATALAGHKSAKQITIKMNSIGGDPFHAIAIYSALKSHGAKVTCQIDGIAASAATLISCAADLIIMNEAGLFMIHEAAWGTYGTVDEQQSILDATKKINEQSAALYAARSGQSLADVKSMMSATTWMTAQEAKDKGFVSELKPLKTMSASVCPGQFASVPDRIKPILAKLSMEVEPMTQPTPTPATPAPAAPAASAPPAAPAVPAPAAAAPAVPVAQPVAPSAEMAAAIKAATERASAITSACVMAGKADMASKYIDDPAATVGSVQGALLQLVCADRKPTGDVGGGAGDPPPPNPNAKFEKEFDDAAQTYANMGLSKAQYVKSRRIDEGLEKLPIVPVAK